MKLRPFYMGLSLGLVWGISIFIFTIISVETGFGEITLGNLAIYPYYTISYPGAAIGLAWGLFDGFIGGFAIVWLYNKLQDWIRP